MIKHTFLCWGPRVEPQVHILTCDQVDRFNNFLLTLSQSGLAQAFTFGEGIEIAVPAIAPALEMLMEYTGVHQDRIRYLAACLVTDTPINPDADDDIEGGAGARLIPPTPVLPPSGAAVKGKPSRIPQPAALF